MLVAGTTDVDDVIESLGHEPNGYFWEGGSDRPALDELSTLLSAVPTDAERLRAAVALARQRGFEVDN